ncbi:hypothetical protein LJC46_04490 [Desulfovibrio sp. OttesenSCG-928-G15]|nr:hypothetical protein [Desulfovibrio sp. OttesenSCG-928-G15]
MTRSAKGLHHKAGHDPRAAALLALNRVLDDNTDSQAALDGVLGSIRLVPTDKRLCTELVYGVLRWYLRLRGFSEYFLAKPDKLPAEMRLVLITALYEMVFLRVPHHAAVNWAVSHVRNRFGKGLAGVANGALRSMQRKLSEFHGPGGTSQPLHARYAMPKWIATLWAERYGETAAEQLLVASQTAPPTGLRFNRLKPQWPALLKELQGEYADEASLVEPALLSFSGPLPWQARTLLKEGRASRQSGASYAALDAFSPADWPLPIWDCCAGRGGKTLALLEQGVAVSLASDPSRQRLSNLGKEYERITQSPDNVAGKKTVPASTGSPDSKGHVQNSNTHAPGSNSLVNSDASGSAESAPPCMPSLTPPPCPTTLVFDASEDGQSLLRELGAMAGPVFGRPVALPCFGTILVDAPCSGLGTMARRPEIRLRRTLEDVERLAALQREILDSVWQALLPGGRIIYLTCTVSPAENEDQIAAFLHDHADAKLEKEYRTSFDSPLHEFFYGACIIKK